LAFRQSEYGEAMTESDIQPQMGSIGALLRQSRLKLGQSLSATAEDLRIRATYLEAIEAGRFGELPGPTYAIGFIRSYAEYLGLDPTEAVRRFKIETEGVRRDPKLRFPAPVAEGASPKAAWLFLGALIAFATYAGWYVLSSRHVNLANLIPPVPERLSHLLGKETASSAPQPNAPRSVALPVPPPTPVPASPLQKAGPSSLPPTPPVAAPAAAPPPVETAPAATDASSVPPTAVPSPPPRSTPETAAAESAATPISSGSDTAGSPANATEGRIVLRATADSWVEVRDPATRAVLLSRVLKAGETFPVPDRAGLRLLTGNAGGVQLIVDGRELPPLGKPGTVRRGIELDPSALLAAAAAGQ
jgi:cytoskeleton protein RodZ